MYVPLSLWKSIPFHNPYTSLLVKDTDSLSDVLIYSGTLVHHIQYSYTLLWCTDMTASDPAVVRSSTSMMIDKQLSYQQHFKWSLPVTAILSILTNNL